MEAVFRVDLEKQFKAFKGPMNRKRVKGLIKIKNEEMISIDMGVIGAQFQERAIKRHTNLDVISILIAWGLEINWSIKEVK